MFNDSIKIFIIHKSFKIMKKKKEKRKGKKEGKEEEKNKRYNFWTNIIFYI